MLMRLTQLADVTWNGWLNSGSANGLLSKSDISPKRMIWVVPAECVSKLTATIKSYSERLHKTLDSCGGRGEDDSVRGEVQFWPSAAERLMRPEILPTWRIGHQQRTTETQREAGRKWRYVTSGMMNNIKNGDIGLDDDSDYLLSDEQLLITSKTLSKYHNI